ncbi:MAG: hypothetical protein GX547_05405 [Phycisphaerae bacterium]|nr:hypothetical protein [Phycisphaerae bacterium]
MADTIKCACSHCGAKYRLPIEAQGRTARCKRCGEKFEVPRQESSLEDTILSWLTPPEEEEADVAKPRVISMPREPVDPEVSKRARGPIRLKEESEPDAKQAGTAKAR